MASMAAATGLAASSASQNFSSSICPLVTIFRPSIVGVCTGRRQSAKSERMSARTRAASGTKSLSALLLRFSTISASRPSRWSRALLHASIASSTVLRSTSRAAASSTVPTSIPGYWLRTISRNSDGLAGNVISNPLVGHDFPWTAVDPLHGPEPVDIHAAEGAVLALEEADWVHIEPSHLHARPIFVIDRLRRALADASDVIDGGHDQPPGNNVVLVVRVWHRPALGVVHPLHSARGRLAGP